MGSSSHTYPKEKRATNSDAENAKNIFIMTAFDTFIKGQSPPAQGKKTDKGNKGKNPGAE